MPPELSLDEINSQIEALSADLGLNSSDTPEISKDEYLPTGVRLPLNTLMENRPGGQEDYLTKLGYEVTRDTDGQIAARPKGTNEAFKRIEPEGWAGGAMFGKGGSILGGLKELGLDTVEGANNVLSTIPNALANISPAKTPFKALGIDTALGAAGGAFTENLTDMGASMLGVSPARSTGDIPPAQRGIALGAMQGAMNTAGNVVAEAGAGAWTMARNSRLGRWLFGTVETADQKGTRMIADSLAIPNKELSGGTFIDNMTGEPVEGAVADLTKVGLDSPAEHVIDSMKNDYGFFDEVRTLSKQTGESYDIAADKILQNELNATGEGIGKAVKKIAEDPQTSVPYSEWAAQLDAVKDETKTTLGGAYSNNPEINLTSFASTVDRVVETQKENIKGAASQIIIDERANIETQLAKESKDLNSLYSQIKPLETKSGLGKKLTPTQQAKYAELKSLATTKQEAVDALAKQHADYGIMLKDPPINFQMQFDAKKGIGTTAFGHKRDGAYTPSGVALKNISGALSRYITEVAQKGKDPELAGLFQAQLKKYSTFSDMAEYAAAFLGKAKKEAPYEGLVNSIRGGSSVRPSGLTIFGVLSGGPKTSKSVFEEGVNNLSTPDPGRIKQGIDTALAFTDKMMSTVKPNLLIGQQVARSIKDSNYMKTLSNQIMLSVFSDSGVIQPGQTQSGVDLDTLPPNIVAQAQQETQQIIGPLQAAMKFGDDNDVGMALSTVAKQFPDLFPKPVTGINGEVSVGGKIKLFDPMDRAKYTDQILQDSKMSWQEKADIISELNNSFEVKNPKGKK